MMDIQKKEMSDVKKLKILLVEDVKINRKIVISQIKQLNYKADSVENGKEALDRLASQSYDLVFMDCQMPVLDGYQATRLLREREGETAHTLVIGLTAYAVKGDREKCLEAGMDDYLTKPVTIQQLANTIKKWFPTKELLINTSRLTEISGGDRDFEINLLDTFIEQTQGNLQQLKESSINSDLALLAQTANQIEGSSANVGITSLSDIAKKIQDRAECNNLKTVDSLIGELNSILEQVKAEISEFKREGDQSSEPSHNVATSPPIESEKPEIDRPQLQSNSASNSEKSTDESIIDRDRLIEISRGDCQFIEELLAAFVQNTETILQEASAALAANDLETLARRAHQIKGSSATVGVRLMPEVAVSLQKQAKENKLENLPKLLQQLKDILALVKNWRINA